MRAFPLQGKADGDVPATPQDGPGLSWMRTQRAWVATTVPEGVSRSSPCKVAVTMSAIPLGTVGNAGNRGTQLHATWGASRDMISRRPAERQRR